MPDYLDKATPPKTLTLGIRRQHIYGDGRTHFLLNFLQREKEWPVMETGSKTVFPSIFSSHEHAQIRNRPVLPDHMKKIWSQAPHLELSYLTKK